MSDLLKINMGAGKRILPGYFNIDVIEGPTIHLCSDAKKVPLPDGCASEILAIHLFEHLYRWECEEALAEWRRLLVSGGTLVLEMPNIVKCCQNVIDEVQRGGKDPDQLGMWGLYGDPRLQEPYMVHRWGWSPKSIRPVLAAAGFESIKETLTQFHPCGRTNRDMRIEAVKP